MSVRLSKLSHHYLPHPGHRLCYDLWTNVKCNDDYYQLESFIIKLSSGEYNIVDTGHDDKIITRGFSGDNQENSLLMAQEILYFLRVLQIVEG